ncbi:MAG: FAD-binding oxidoreductase [Flavobacteriaceae bacterium]|nr:FAD-binding oxidoreductase [Flavobacteriaceae bacterium]
MTDSLTLKVNYIQELTPNSKVIGFDIPKEFESNFFFKAGQFITLEVIIKNQTIRRAYSICSTPSEKNFRIAVKKLKNGLCSEFLNSNLRIGDIIHVNPPKGNFLYDPTSETKNLLGFAAGSGITPIYSILKSCIFSNSNNHFTLLYGNKNIEDTMFYIELKELEKNYPDQLTIFWLFSRSSEPNSIFGRIDKSTINAVFKIISAPINFYYICGPNNMTDSIKEILINKSISKENISCELFNSNIPTLNKNKLSEDKNIESSLELKYEELTYNISLSLSDTILETILNNNIDVPYSCQGGVCSTCIARLKEGEVKMANNQILTEDEIEEGLILTCISSPKSKKIIVDYDDV